MEANSLRLTETILFAPHRLSLSQKAQTVVSKLSKSKLYCLLHVIAPRALVTRSRIEQVPLRDSTTITHQDTVKSRMMAHVGKVMLTQTDRRLALQQQVSLQ